MSQTSRVEAQPQIEDKLPSLETLSSQGSLLLPDLEKLLSEVKDQISADKLVQLEFLLDQAQELNKPGSEISLPATLDARDQEQFLRQLLEQIGENTSVLPNIFPDSNVDGGNGAWGLETNQAKIAKPPQEILLPNGNGESRVLTLEDQEQFNQVVQRVAEVFATLKRLQVLAIALEQSDMSALPDAFSGFKLTKQDIQAQVKDVEASLANWQGELLNVIEGKPLNVEMLNADLIASGEAASVVFATAAAAMPATVMRELSFSERERGQMSKELMMGINAAMLLLLLAGCAASSADVPQVSATPENQSDVTTPIEVAANTGKIITPEERELTPKEEMLEVEEGIEPGVSEAGKVETEVAQGVIFDVNLDEVAEFEPRLEAGGLESLARETNNRVISGFRIDFEGDFTREFGVFSGMSFDNGNDVQTLINGMILERVGEDEWENYPMISAENVTLTVDGEVREFDKIVYAIKVVDITSGNFNVDEAAKPIVAFLMNEADGEMQIEMMLAQGEDGVLRPVEDNNQGLADHLLMKPIQMVDSLVIPGEILDILPNGWQAMANNWPAVGGWQWTDEGLELQDENGVAFAIRKANGQWEALNYSPAGGSSEAPAAEEEASTSAAAGRVEAIVSAPAGEKVGKSITNAEKINEASPEISPSIEVDGKTYELAWVPGWWKKSGDGAWRTLDEIRAAGRESEIVSSFNTVFPGITENGKHYVINPQNGDKTEVKPQNIPGFGEIDPVALMMMDPQEAMNIFIENVIKASGIGEEYIDRVRSTGMIPYSAFVLENIAENESDWIYSATMDVGGGGIPESKIAFKDFATNTLLLPLFDKDTGEVWGWLVVNQGSGPGIKAFTSSGGGVDQNNESGFNTGGELGNGSERNGVIFLSTETEGTFHGLGEKSFLEDDLGSEEALAKIYDLLRAGKIEEAIAEIESHGLFVAYPQAEFFEEN